MVLTIGTNDIFAFSMQGYYQILTAYPTFIIVISSLYFGFSLDSDSCKFSICH